MQLQWSSMEHIYFSQKNISTKCEDLLGSVKWTHCLHWCSAVLREDFCCRKAIDVSFSPNGSHKTFDHCPFQRVVKTRFPAVTTILTTECKFRLTLRHLFKRKINKNWLREFKTDIVKFWFDQIQNKHHRLKIHNGYASL